MDYSAGEAALSNVMKSLSKEYGPRGVRFNTVSPGSVETGQRFEDDGIVGNVAEHHGLSAADARDAVVDGEGAFSNGRFTKPEEVAALVLDLAGGTMREINGSDFVIDGGVVKTTRLHVDAPVGEPG